MTDHVQPSTVGPRPHGGRTTAATQASRVARKRRSQETWARRLGTEGWLCFPPEKVPILRAFLDAHQAEEGCA